MENVTRAQSDLLARLREIDPALAVRWDAARGVASSVRGTLATPGTTEGEPQDSVKRFLAGYGEIFGPPRIAQSLRLLEDHRNSLGWTRVEFQQTHRTGTKPGEKPQPLEVYGAKLVARLKPDGTLIQVQSSCWREIVVGSKPRVTLRALRGILTKQAAAVPAPTPIDERGATRRQPKGFPIMQPPRLVVYYWQGTFRLTWVTYAYTAVPAEDASGRPTGAKRLELGQIFLDASTGEQLLFSSLAMDVAGTGRGVTPVLPVGGPYVLRNLNVVQVGTSNTFRLEDTTHARGIITYDLACDPQWYNALTQKTDVDAIAAALSASAGGPQVSENTTGSAWTLTVPGVARADSQQPEVDAHFFCREAYEWYDALAAPDGRAGWDGAGPLASPLYTTDIVPANQPVRILTHAHPCGLINAEFRVGFLDVGPPRKGWHPFLIFYDGNPATACAAPGDRGFDGMAGSKNVVGHEYQHAITTFSMKDGAGYPGLGYRHWTAVVHEGLADVFGCLFAERWSWGPEICHASPSLIIRNAAFPRDPLAWENRSGAYPCGLAHNNKDHFDDRNVSTAASLTSAQDAAQAYNHGTILAHCAYLMGQGGAHQRLVRTPALIPVYGMGRETVAGKSILKAARIWYRALTEYFRPYVTTTGLPNLDESMFHALRDGCLDAAEDLYGANSRERRTVALAFYAVGLKEPGVSYGADVTFLRWGWDWRFSRPFLGGIQATSPDWASLDLFVNNGGLSEWNAVVNVLDATGNPTQFENSVYCRVRNVGDLDAVNVRLQFFYAKVGTGIGAAGWLPVTDKAGVVQTLTVNVPPAPAGTLQAGQMSFPEDAQHSPPAGAGVKWYIPPLAAGETVDHFCLKATVTCNNDVNVFNNEVQSNIVYVGYAGGTSSGLGFLAANPTDEEIPLELSVRGELPEGWRAYISDAPGEARLRPGEARVLRVEIDMARGADERLEAPLDGEVEGRLFGPLSGSASGAITETREIAGRLSGRIGLDVDGLGVLVGHFDGSLDFDTGGINGRVTGVFQSGATGASEPVGVGLDGWLRPWRRMNIAQLIKDDAIGGITVQVQGARPADHDGRPPLPPTQVRVS